MFRLFSLAVGNDWPVCGKALSGDAHFHMLHLMPNGVYSRAFCNLSICCLCLQLSCLNSATANVLLCMSGLAIQSPALRGNVVVALCKDVALIAEGDGGWRGPSSAERGAASQHPAQRTVFAVPERPCFCCVLANHRWHCTLESELPPGRHSLLEPGLKGCLSSCQVPR